MQPEIKAVSCMPIRLSLTNENQKRITMRKMVVAEFLSLDGVMEQPACTAPYWNDEIAKFKLVIDFN